MARVENWTYMLLAFVMSVALWYMVVGQERVEQPITLRIEYSGVPSDLVIKDGLVQTITIQLRGPRGLIRTASESRYTYTVDLSHIKKGMNIVPLTTKKLPFTRAFEVVDMKPSRLTLDVDALIERELGVDVHMREGLAKNIDIKNFRWKPESVLVRGPESIVSKILRLHAEVSPPSTANNRTVKVEAPIVVPALVDAIPVQVEVSYDAMVAMTECVLERTLSHSVSLDYFEVIPPKVSIRVAVPAADVHKQNILNAITARVDTFAVVPYDPEPYNNGIQLSGKIGPFINEERQQAPTSSSERVLDVVQKLPVRVTAPLRVKVLEVMPPDVKICRRAGAAPTNRTLEPNDISSRDIWDTLFPDDTSFFKIPFGDIERDGGIFTD